jgi:hypothetical protein
VYVSYAGTKWESKPRNAGPVRGSQSDWTVSNPVNLHPGDRPGWQLVQFTLVPRGETSESQVYDFYVDPRMH